MRGSLALVGRLFGQLQLVQTPVMIELIGPMSVLAGDALRLCLTVTDDADARVNLTGAAIELQVKRTLGAADPATIAKAIGTGITLRDQTQAATKGQADIVITSANTTQPPGLYWLDVVVDNGDRTHVIAPREFTIGAVVNLP